MITILSFGLDIIILLALGVTIFYAIRLSQNLNKFRMHREEFLLFMEELSQNIDAAENAVQSLQQASLTTADQLRRKVRDGQNLYDELKIIVDSAENIANRLEGTVTKTNEKKARGQKQVKNSQSIESGEAVEGEDDWFIEDIPKAPNNNKSSKKRKEKEGQIPSFLIQDREFSHDNTTQKDTKFKSQAEKDLYNALQQQNTKAK